MSIRIMLVDDHTLVRAGFRSLLESLPDVEIIAEANNGYDAIEMVKKLHPDLVLMDIAMPGINGLETTERIIKEFPDVRVILLSMYTNEEYVLEAVRMGASGYIVKDADAAEFEMAIRSVAGGGSYLSPSISKHVINGLRRAESGAEDAPRQLSPRQREILRLIAEGCTTKEIASRLGITLKTVDTHRTQMMRDLNIHNIAGLVLYAVRIGLVKTDT